MPKRPSRTQVETAEFLERIGLHDVAECLRLRAEIDALIAENKKETDEAARREHGDKVIAPLLFQLLDAQARADGLPR